jgi:Ca2+-binding RTX toxin-like protein
MNDLEGASARESRTSYALNDAASVQAETLTGGAGADTLEGGRGDDVIDGNQGADLMLGGAGRDTLIWDPGDGSDTLDGGAGFDTHLFNTSNGDELMTLSAGVGGHAILTRNLGSITMDIDNVERVVFGGAGGGADSITIGDLRGTDIRQVEIDLGLAAGGPDTSSDTVFLGGTAGADRFALTAVNGGLSVAGAGVDLTISDSTVADKLVLSTGAGDDVFDASGAAGAIGVEFDGGAGADAVLIHGGKADDALVLSGGGANPVDFGVNGAFSAVKLTNVEAIVVEGGSGDDVIDASGFTGPAALVVDAGNGSDRILGGRGADRLVGGQGDDTIDGNQGADLMLGGAGRDSLIWDPGDGSDTIDGGAGFDTHLFNTSGGDEVMSLTAGPGGHAILTRNLGSIAMDLDNVERVVFGAGDGADKITVGDLRGTDIRQVDAQGGAGADTLDASTLQGRVEVTFTGGAGADRFVFAANAGGEAHVSDFAAHSLGAVADLVQLIGSSDASFAAALANHHIAQAGADVVVSDATGVIVTLQNVSLGALQASDFLFG